MAEPGAAPDRGRHTGFARQYGFAGVPRQVSYVVGQNDSAAVLLHSLAVCMGAIAGVLFAEIRAYAWPDDKDMEAVILPGKRNAQHGATFRREASFDHRSSSELNRSGGLNDEMGLYLLA
jgi:hypothetical protein